MGNVRRAALAAALATALAGCWPAPGAGPDRTGANPFETRIGVGNVATLTAAWSVDLGDSATDPVTTADGVFVTASSGALSSVHGLDAVDGGARWSVPLYGVDGYPPTYETGAYVVGDDVLAGWAYTERRPVFVREMGTARIDPVTGGVVRRTGAEVTEGGGAVAAVRGDTVVYAAAGIPDGAVANRTDIAVEDAADPSRAWSATVSAGGEPAVTLGADGTVFQVGPGSLATTPGTDVASGWGVRAFRPGGPDGCVDAFTVGGVAASVDLTCPAWAVPLAGAPSAPVLVPGTGSLVVASADGVVHGIDRATGAVLWTAAVGANGTTPALDPAGVLHVPLAAGGTAALRLADCATGTCAAAWTTAGAGGQVRAQPAVANGVVYTGSDDGTLTAAAAAGCGGVVQGSVCAPLWTADAGSPVTGAPAVSTGRLVVATADGRVLAYAPPA